MGKALPIFLSPFPVDFWSNAPFFSDEENEDPALFNSHLRGSAIVLPEGRSGPRSWILRPVRDPRFAPCPPWSWICHQFRIAWLRCVVWMDGRASQVHEMPQSPSINQTSFSFLPLIFVQSVGFSFPLTASLVFYFWFVCKLSPASTLASFCAHPRRDSPIQASEIASNIIAIISNRTLAT